MAITNLTNCTWIANSTLSTDLISLIANINFKANGGTYSMFYRLCDGQRDIVQYGGFVVYSTAVEYPYWTYPSYRTIEITGGTDVTNPTLINYLQNNGTLIKNVNMSGRTFYIKEDIKLPESLRIVANFESGDSSWNEIDLSVIDGIGQIYYLNQAGYTLAYDSTTGWEIEYRYLTFGENVKMSVEDYDKFIGAYHEYIDPSKLKKNLRLGTKKIIKAYKGNKLINKCCYKRKVIFENNNNL